MGTKHIVPRAEGQGGIGTATLGWGELFITNTTNDSATQGGKLTLTSNDGNAMQSGSRLGVIEFKGAESSSALIIGARIEAICDAAWSDTENGASLKFYTTDDNASESLVLTLDSNKLAVFSGAVAITGNLTVNGTTTTVNSTIVTIDDPVFTLGGDTAPVSETTQDKGIEFRYHTGSAAKIGFFGWDDSASAFTFIPDATNNSEVFSGSAGNAIFGNITGTLQTAAQTNITSVGALNGGTITSGFGAINNGASTITTTGVISGGSLDIDNVLINGTTIGHTDDTDLMTLADGVLTVAGELNAVSLDISGNADIDGTLETDALSINGTAVTASAADINLIDGITNGTVIASKAIITDSNKDITGGRNITISGELDAATLDISGNVSIDGTLEAGAITVRPLAGGVQNATLELIGRTGGGFGGGLVAKSSIYSETSGAQYSANLVFKTNNSSNSLTERLRLNYNGDAIFSGEIKAPEATFSGDVTFTGASYNAVWDTSANLLQFADNAAIRIGTGNDVDIYHSSNVTYIKTQTDLPIKFIDAGGADMLKLTPNGSVDLYHNGTLALSTASGGAATFSGDVRFEGDLYPVKDNGFIYFGSNSTARIQHISSSNSLAINPNGGNVGIGTTSPAGYFYNGGGMGIYGGTTRTTLSIISNTFSSLYFSKGDGTSSNSGANAYQGYIDYQHSNDSLQFGTAQGERMRISSAGAIGQAVTPLTDPYVASGEQWMTYQIGKGGIFAAYKNNNESMFGFNTYTKVTDGAHKAIISDIGGSATRYYADRITFNTLTTSGTAQTQTEVMRISPANGIASTTDSFHSGHDGSTGSSGAGTATVGCTLGSGGWLTAHRTNATCLYIGTTTDREVMAIFKGTSQAGKIRITGASTVAFESGSDYRLKEDLKDFNGLDIISKLKVYNFNWIGEDRRDHGLIAHEVQEVLPDLVSGEKDGVLDNGKIDKQTLDYGRFTPMLIKAIQEQQTIIEDLKSRIETLEG